MLRFKASRGYWNLVFDVDSLKRIWKDNRLTIYYPGFEVRSMKDVADLRGVVTQGLKKYVDVFYSKQEAIGNEKHETSYFGGGNWHK